jgi:hypothetical protein
MFSPNCMISDNNESTTKKEQREVPSGFELGNEGIL